MKIAIICEVLGEANNGTTLAALNLISYLKSRGHDVRVVCPDEDKRGLPGYYILPRRSGKCSYQEKQAELGQIRQGYNI